MNVRVTADKFTKTRVDENCTVYRADITWYKDGKRWAGRQQDFLRSEWN